MQQLLNKLDIHEGFQDEDHALRIGKFLEKQAYMRALECHYQPCHVNPGVQDTRLTWSFWLMRFDVIKA